MIFKLHYLLQFGATLKIEWIYILNIVEVFLSWYVLDPWGAHLDPRGATVTTLVPFSLALLSHPTLPRPVGEPVPLTPDTYRELTHMVVMRNVTFFLP